MNRLIPAILALCWMAPQDMNAQQTQGTMLPIESHSGPDFDAFVASEGWIFVADMPKGVEFPNLEGTPSADGTTVFSADDFDPTTFDPRLWAIEYSADPALPTNFRVGDRGALQFHSVERCQGLYSRHLTRRAKGQR
jgi:hypothetical protein